VTPPPNASPLAAAPLAAPGAQAFTPAPAPSYAAQAAPPFSPAAAPSFTPAPAAPLTAQTVPWAGPPVPGVTPAPGTGSAAAPPPAAAAPPPADGRPLEELPSRGSGPKNRRPSGEFDALKRDFFAREADLYKEDAAGAFDDLDPRKPR
jgi:hypothetical protein